MAKRAPERFNPAVLYHSQQSVNTRKTLGQKGQSQGSGQAPRDMSKQDVSKQDAPLQKDASFSVELPLISFKRVVELIAAEASYNDGAALDSAETKDPSAAGSQVPNEEPAVEPIVSVNNEQLEIRPNESVETAAAALNALQTFRAEFDLGLFSTHGFSADWTFEDEADGDKLLATESVTDDRAAKAPVILAKGQMRAEMVMQCQRCLGHFEHAIEAPFSFVFAGNEATANAMPDAMDPVLLDDEGYVSLVDMFEDELLLHVPAFARHKEESDCTFDEVPFTQHSIAEEDLREDGSAKRENPFSALKNLKFGDKNSDSSDT